MALMFRPEPYFQAFMVDMQNREAMRQKPFQFFQNMSDTSGNIANTIYGIRRQQEAERLKAEALELLKRRQMGYDVPGQSPSTIPGQRLNLGQLDEMTQGDQVPLEELIYNRSVSPTDMLANAPRPVIYPIRQSTSEQQPLFNQMMTNRNPKVITGTPGYHVPGEMELDYMNSMAKNNALQNQKKTSDVYFVDSASRQMFDRNMHPISMAPEGATPRIISDPYAGSEFARRDSLVQGAKYSIGVAKTLISQDVLNELKAIQKTPGRFYSDIASPEAKEFYRNIKNAISDNLYLKTGATANPGELEQATLSYMPALNETPEDMLSRLQMLENDTTYFSNPRNASGSGSPSPKDIGVPEEPIPRIRRINSQSEYDSLPSGYEYIDSNGNRGRKR